jgi:hypothetical protein
MTNDMTDPLALPPRGAAFSSSLAFIGRWLLLGGAAGGVAGLLVGGVGGRLSMFVLRLTSPDSVRGIESDDGFTIGEFSVQTVFLLGLATAIGLLVGVTFIALRSQLPGRFGAAMVVLAGGTLGASAIIKPNGVDFTKLAPLPLACAMFTVIPLAGAALTLWLIGRWQRWWWHKPRRTAIACAPWILAVPSFFVSVPTILVILAAAAGVLHVPFLRAPLTNRIGRTLATALTATIIVLASIALANDLKEIL